MSERCWERSLTLGKRWTYGELALGIAAHDAYHTGQIQLLKRLWQERALLGRGGSAWLTSSGKPGPTTWTWSPRLFDAYRQFYEQPPDLALARAFIGGRLERGESIVFLAERAADRSASGNSIRCFRRPLPGHAACGC